MSERTKGQQHRLGKPKSAEEIEKIRSAQQGRSFSPEHLAKLRAARQVRAQRELAAKTCPKVASG